MNAITRRQAVASVAGAGVATAVAGLPVMASATNPDVELLRLWKEYVHLDTVAYPKAAEAIDDATDRANFPVRPKIMKRILRRDTSCPNGTGPIREIRYEPWGDLTRENVEKWYQGRFRSPDFLGNGKPINPSTKVRRKIERRHHYHLMKLARYEAEYEAERQRVGLPELERHEQKTWKRIDAVRNKILETPSAGAAGISVKIAVAGSMDYGPAYELFPNTDYVADRALRSAYEDAKRLGGLS